MKFLVLMKATNDIEAGVFPKSEEIAKMIEFNEELVRDGVLLAADGLLPSSKGTRLRFDGDRTTVTDGPFAETKELIAGYWIVQGKSRAEIVERFKHAPFDHGQVLEVREYIGAEDFGDELTPEQRERVERMEGAAAPNGG
jgi:hypothetical protein